MAARRRFTFVLMAAVLGGLLFGAYTLTSTPGGWRVALGMPLDRAQALQALRDLTPRIDRVEQIVTRRARVPVGARADLKASLPDIEQFPVTVDGRGVALELFVSTEKSGSGTDGWLNEVAAEFNRSGPRLADGRPMSIRVRKIASGTGYEFIASGKYVPDGFSPSNHLWVEMARAHDVPMTAVRERLVGNVAGIVMRTEVAARVRERYGDLTLPSVIDAVVQGDLVMGYTDPFASSTGLNFLVTVLARFAADDPQQLLSAPVVSAFESFQRGVPFVALTTLQMRESVQNDGSLDAFVMEYQTYARTAELASGYEFIPFGLRHDNPLYLVGEPTAERREGLELFARFAEQPRYTALADEYGFNVGPAHQPGYQMPPGAMLLQAQRLWKEKKDGGRPVMAVFLVDVSGSMRGTRLQQLQRALAAGAEFIEPGNAIGLVSFSTSVTTLLPVKRFDLAHKASFLAAVEDLRAGGNTAMYDGVAVALEMLADALAAEPQAKPILFVLSDGATNRGLAFDEMAPLIGGLQVPVYTIGYEADLSELRRLSSLVEAASLDAREGEIQYKIGALLNAQM